MFFCFVSYELGLLVCRQLRGCAGTTISKPLAAFVSQQGIHPPMHPMAFALAFLCTYFDRRSPVNVSASILGCSVQRCCVNRSIAKRKQRATLLRSFAAMRGKGARNWMEAGKDQSTGHSRWWPGAHGAAAATEDNLGSRAGCCAAARWLEAMATRLGGRTESARPARLGTCAVAASFRQTRAASRAQHDSARGGSVGGSGGSASFLCCCCRRPGEGVGPGGACPHPLRLRRAATHYQSH